MLLILQCRLKSTRLPGKLLHTFFGESILERMIKIAKNVPSVNHIVVAIGGNYGSPLLLKIIKKNNVSYYIGHEHDVLGRFISIIKKFDDEYFLRLTCDNYLAQPSLIESLYKQTIKNNSEYGYIDPLSNYSGEVVKKKSFLNFHKNNNPSRNDIEHVTWDFRKSELTKKTILDNKYLNLDHSIPYTLDTLDDLIKMKYLEEHYPELKKYDCLSDLKKISISNLF